MIHSYLSSPHRLPVTLPAGVTSTEEMLQHPFTELSLWTMHNKTKRCFCFFRLRGILGQMSSPRQQQNICSFLEQKPRCSTTVNKAKDKCSKRLITCNYVVLNKLSKNNTQTILQQSLKCLVDHSIFLHLRTLIQLIA